MLRILKSPRVGIILELYEKTLSAGTHHKDNNSCYHKSYHKTTTYSLGLKRKKTREVFAKEVTAI